MGRFSDIVLISDIDGTLFSSVDTIPPENVRAIKYFIRHGGRFSVATGRSQMSVRHNLEKFSVNCPGIVFNGSVVYDFAGRRPLFQRQCNENLVRATKNMQAKYPFVCCLVFAGNRMYTPAICDYNDIAQRIECINSTLVSSFDEITEPWIKTAFFGPEEYIDAMLALFQVSGDETFDVIKSATNIVELLPKDANKGTALEELAKILGVPMSNMCAIGDYYNDLAMLRTAGYSAAPANSPDDIRGFVNAKVCSNTEGAVAEFIEDIEKHLDRFAKLSQEG